MNLEYFFSKHQIVKISATDKQHAIRALLQKLQDLGQIEHVERYYTQIIYRELLENTGIGNSLAIPHVRTESLDTFSTILGICTTPIEYNSLDNKPVRYILLSVFPVSMSTKYLYLIGMMARIFSNTKKKELLDKVTAPGKIYSILNKETNAYFKSISIKDDEKFSISETLSGVPSSDLDLLIRLDRLCNYRDENGKTASLQKKISDLKKLIDYKSLSYYERMRKKRSNPFAFVEKENCTGCHMDIPTINMKQIRDREGVPTCPYCGRFLIHL